MSKWGEGGRDGGREKGEEGEGGREGGRRVRREREGGREGRWEERGKEGSTYGNSVVTVVKNYFHEG